MSAGYETNIKRLLEAEKKAEELIKRAEGARDHTLEQANEIARSKIDQERKSMAADFDSKKVDNTKDRDALMKQAAIEVKKDQELFERNKDQVANMLVDRVMFVAYELPKNVKRDYASLKNPHTD